MRSPLTARRASIGVALIFGAFVVSCSNDTNVSGSTTATNSIAPADASAAFPTVPKACTLLTDAEVASAWGATTVGKEEPTNASLAYCTWFKGNAGDNFQIEVKGIDSATLTRFRKLSEGQVAAGTETALAGIGDYAVYDPGLNAVSAYVGQRTISILSSPSLPTDTLAALLKTAVARL